MSIKNNNPRTNKNSSEVEFIHKEFVTIDRIATIKLLMEWASGVSDCASSLDLLQEAIREEEGKERESSFINIVIEKLKKITFEINKLESENL